MITVVSPWNLIPVDWDERFGENLEMFQPYKWADDIQIGDMVLDRHMKGSSGLGIVVNIDKNRGSHGAITVLWGPGKPWWEPVDEDWIFNYKLDPRMHEKKRGRRKR